MIIIIPIIFIALLISWSNLFGQNKKINKTVYDLDWNDLRGKIFPYLKQSLPLSDSNSTFEIEEKYKPIIDKYIEDIVITYLIDYDNKFTYINQNLLKKWNIDVDSLRKTALNNLDNLSNSAKIQGDSNYFGIILEGNLEASLILSEIFWKYISDIVKNKDLVIAIPARDVLLVTHADSKDGLDKLRNGVKQIFELGDHLITKWMFIRKNNSWIKYEYVE